MSNFNSIKVRLEHDRVTFADGTPLFQFHKGTIRTGGVDVLGGVGALFQFHKGTIRTLLAAQNIRS